MSLHNSTLFTTFGPFGDNMCAKRSQKPVFPELQSHCLDPYPERPRQNALLDENQREKLPDHNLFRYGDPVYAKRDVMRRVTDFLWLVGFGMNNTIVCRCSEKDSHRIIL